MPGRVAILLHSEPHGGSHVDLLLTRDRPPASDDERSVPTWRCALRPDRVRAGETLDLERIGDHRALYLRLDTPRVLDGDRGRVTPLRAGATRSGGEAGATEDGDDLRIAWDDGGEALWRIRETAPGRWRLDVLA